MKILNKFFAVALGATALLVACGDGGSGTDTTSRTPDPPATPSFTVTSCQEVTDAAVAAELESAKSGIDDILNDFGNGNLKSAQVVSARTKSSFKSVLDKYPSNCEAQLGYALSIITDLINNKEINAYIDTVTNKANLIDMGVEDFNQLLIAGDGKLLTTMQQEAVAAAIPSLDSAIIYMKNIVGDENFTCHYDFEGKRYELDRGEFAPALSVLYVIKAALVFSASINLDLSANGNYDWLNEQVQREQLTKSTADQIIALMDKGSSFTTVHSNWKSRYKDIPNLLDSAIQYVQVGLQYGIDESKQGTATQMNDPYVVGDGEMADVSARDFQKAIDSLEYYRQKLRTGVTVTLPAGSKISINFAKFFDVTDGWQDFLPYHKFNDYDQWFIPVDGFYWDDDPEFTYAESELQKTISDQINKVYKSADVYAEIYYGASKKVCIEVNAKDGHLDDCYNVSIDNCTFTFGTRESYYGDDATKFAPTTIKLSSGVCKTENGQSLYAMPYRTRVANAFYFTDASGKKTLSLQGLLNGKADEFMQRSQPYTLSEIKKLVIFPDASFGGILPGMTNEKLWDIIETEITYAED